MLNILYAFVSSRENIKLSSDSFTRISVTELIALQFKAVNKKLFSGIGIIRFSFLFKSLLIMRIVIAYLLVLSFFHGKSNLKVFNA